MLHGYIFRDQDQINRVNEYTHNFALEKLENLENDKVDKRILNESDIRFIAAELDLKTNPNYDPSFEL